MSRWGTKEGREEDRGRTDKRKWKDRKDGKEGRARKEIKAQILYKKYTEFFNNTITSKLQENFKTLKISQYGSTVRFLWQIMTLHRISLTVVQHKFSGLLVRYVLSTG
jgi:hypothetical protein